MTNEEKIRLVLETLGVDSVRQATRAMRELDKGLEDVGTSATRAAGKGGINGQGILQLAYFIDDMQYGMRGIMNNIPILAMSLGLGTGLAGAASIAAVAIGQLTSRHPEWFEWSEKVRAKLGELTDLIKAEEEAIKRQKEAVDKLSESNSNRIEDIVKLRNATEDLKLSEIQLAEDRKNRKAAEDAESSKGVLVDEEFARQKGIVKDVITDSGAQGELLNVIRRSVTEEFGEITEDEVLRRASRIASEEGGASFSALSPENQLAVASRQTGRARAMIQLERHGQIRQRTEEIFGGLINPKSLEELNNAFAEIEKRIPNVAREMRDLYRSDREQEEFDKELEARSRAAAERREAERRLQQGIDRGMKFGPDRSIFDDAQRQKIFSDQARTEAREAANAAIQNQVISQFDPFQMAALRRQQAGQGPFSQRAMIGLENRDIAIFANALREQGFTGDPEAAARQSLSGGVQQFADFAAQVREFSGRNVSAVEAAAMAIQKSQQDVMQLQMRLQMAEQQITLMTNGQKMNTRPQHFKANR